MLIESLIEMCAECYSEMAPGGKAQHSDTIGVNMPLGGVTSNQAQRPLRILKSQGRLGIGSGARYTIFDQNAGDAGGSEPVADLGAFQVGDENVVAASGKNDNRRPGVFSSWRVQGESWV